MAGPILVGMSPSGLQVPQSHCWFNEWLRRTGFTFTLEDFTLESLEAFVG
jgi:hypothetical protein